MGQRSKTETVVAILQAFLQDRSRSWKQAELARHVGVGVTALRKHLEELAAQGFPLESEKEHPHIWWSVPVGWFPGAVLFDSNSVPHLLRQLSHLPRSKVRDGLIHRILAAAPKPFIAPPEEPVVHPPERTEREELFLALAEDAALQKVCLEFKYFTMSRNDRRWRHASVQSVLPGPPARFIAICHRSKSLKWFRVASVQDAKLDIEETFEAAEPGQVEAMLKESVDGFCQGDAFVCSFFVREPESRWVEHNLPGSMSPASMVQEAIRDGVRFTTKTAGVLRLARFVVGLGVAARAETPELAELVKELARGALEASGAPAGELRSHPSTEPS